MAPQKTRQKLDGEPPPSYSTYCCRQVESYVENEKCISKQVLHAANENNSTPRTSSLFASLPTLIISALKSSSLHSSLTLSLEPVSFTTTKENACDAPTAKTSSSPSSTTTTSSRRINYCGSVKSKLERNQHQTKNDVAKANLKLHHIQSSTSSSSSPLTSSFTGLSYAIKHSLCLYAVSSLIIVLLYLTSPTAAYDTVHPM